MRAKFGRKFFIDELCHVIDAGIPRLGSLNECDEIEAKVDLMHKSGLVVYARYLRWKKGINNARKLLNEEG